MLAWASKLWHVLVSGMAAAGSLFEPAQYQLPEGNDQECIGQDFRRIFGDLDAVIARELDRSTPPAPPASR